MKISYQTEDGKSYWKNLRFSSNKTSEQIFQTLDKEVRKIFQNIKKNTRLKIERSDGDAEKERIALLALVLFYQICKAISEGGVVVVLSEIRETFCLFEEINPIVFWENFNVEDKGIKFLKVDDGLVISLPIIGILRDR